VLHDGANGPAISPRYPGGAGAMNHIFAMHVLRKIVQKEKVRREMQESTEMGLMYMGSVIVVVLSFSAFQYLA
jgi:hypothetical protein